MKSIAAAGILALAPSFALATTLTINGGTAGQIPNGGFNNLLGPLGLSDPLDGYFNSSIGGSSGAAYRYEFFGFEAGFSNSLVAGGNSFSTEDPGYNETLEASGALLDKFTTGTLNFTFFVQGGANSVSNGDANLVTSAPNFFASIVGDATATSGSSVWLFLDDGGAGPDDNHDDMVVRITAIPLPAAGGFLLAAIGGLGLIGRRRKNA